MKIKYALATAIAVFALAACEVPEDEPGTAADRVETKDAAKEDAKPKDKDKDKDKAENNKGDQGKAEEKPAGPVESASEAQARQKAAEYLDFSAFSRPGLIEQLEFEGFNTKDATYGVDAQNANWSAQAALKAKEYLDYSSFSRSGLIEQLVFEGFTQAQAEFGVNKVGL